MSNWDIVYTPLIASWGLWLFSTLIICVWLYFIIRRVNGALLRGTGLLLLFLALLNPSLRQEERDPLNNIVLVLVDKSPSQIISGRQELVESTKTILKDKLKQINNLDIEFVSLDDSNGNVADGTLGFAQLRAALSRIPTNRISGVIMITDGQIHDAPAKFSDLGLNVPFHTLLTGEQGQFDRRIEIVKAPRYGIVGAERDVTLKVVEQGQGSEVPDTVKLTIRQKGSQERTQFVKVGEEISLPLNFPHAGINLMEIEVEADDQEITTANNRAVITAEGVRENLRVLLVSGEPHAGERTWRNLLKSDASVDLVHFTILRPPEKQDGTPIHQLSLIAFPTRELFAEKLDEFDLIIFDRYQRRGVLPLHYLDNVSQYVLNGGAVLIAAGEKFASPSSLANTPLDQIIPAQPTGQVFEQPYRPTVTPKGSRHPVTHNLPKANRLKPKTDARWGKWFRLIEARITEGEAIMTGAQKHPLLVLNRLGEGRIALLLSDHAWLWARSFDGGGPYTTLLRRLSHWLMKEPDLEEESLQAKGEGRTLVVTRRTMQEKIDPVTITRPDGSVEKVELKQETPGFWQAKLSKQMLGIHRVKSGKLNTLAFIGYASAKEMKNIVTSDRVFGPLAKQANTGLFWTGKLQEGQALSLPKVSMITGSKRFAGSDWMALKDRQAYIVKGVRLIPLLAGLIALGFFLIIFGSMWWREGR